MEKETYYEKNREKILKLEKEYREKNKEKISKRKKLYRETNKKKIKELEREYSKKRKESKAEYYQKNKERIKKVRQQYLKNNKEKINKQKNEYRRHKLETDPLYKLKRSIHHSINKSLKRNGYKKSSKTHEILGCSFEEFKTHIESQWVDWMNWDNYGKYNGEENYGWDFDHIIPSSSAINEQELINLNHHTNLQPLCSKINRDIKRDNT